MLSEFDSCSFSRNGLKPLVKSPTIWGHKGNVTLPLCYLMKPKYMSDAEWDDFLDGFSFELKPARKEAKDAKREIETNDC